MDAHNAAEVLEFLEQRGLEVYVDGGWAVEGGQDGSGAVWNGIPAVDTNSKRSRTDRTYV